MLGFNLSTLGIELLLTKVFFLVVCLLMSLFLLVVLRQVILMTKLVNDASDTALLKTIGIVLLIFSLSLFLTALVIL